MNVQHFTCYKHWYTKEETQTIVKTWFCLPLHISQIQWHVNMSWYRDVNSTGTENNDLYSSNHHVWAQLNLSYQPVTQRAAASSVLFSKNNLQIFTLTHCAWHASDRTACKQQHKKYRNTFATTSSSDLRLLILFRTTHFDFSSRC